MAMCVLPTDIVNHLAEHCPARTNEALQPRFGISYNTLRQIERGHAVRASVAVRLIERIRAERLLTEGKSSSKCDDSVRGWFEDRPSIDESRDMAKVGYGYIPTNR